MTNLYKALAAFQAEVGTIPKTTQGHGYKYADLDTIWAAVRPVLARHGLVVVQMPCTQSGVLGLQTIVAHVSGESVVAWLAAPEASSSSRNTAEQRMGISITYLRRYALSAALGLTTDEDTDGAWIEEEKRKASTERTAEQDAEIASAAEAVALRCTEYTAKADFSAERKAQEQRWGKPLPGPILKAMEQGFADYQKRSTK
jgi:hypothetical protein